MDIGSAIVWAAAILGFFWMVSQSESTMTETLTCSCGSSKTSSSKRRIDEFERAHRDCVALDATIKAKTATTGRQHV